jgi:hypothetical protein
VVAGLLATYVTAVLAFTVLSRRPKPIPDALNLDAIGTIVSRMRGPARYEIVLNVAMLLPVGMLLPVVCGCRWRPTMLMCALLSVLVESAQLVWSLGTCELSDVLCNVAGAALGYAAYAAVRLLAQRCETPSQPGRYVPRHMGSRDAR